MTARKLAGLLLAGLGLLALSAAPAQAQSFEEALVALDAGSFDDKEKAIEAFAAVADERVVSVLVAMEDGRLFRRKVGMSPLQYRQRFGRLAQQLRDYTG